MTRLANYDSNQVKLVIAGIPIEDGRADEFITLEADEAAFTTEVGADGLVIRYATHSTLYTATLRLKGASAENQKLSALHALDANSPNGDGIGAFLLKDLNGATLAGSDKCWIEKAPATTFGKQRPDVEWVIKVVATPGQVIIGGN